jgi:hypothetical protein
MTRGKQKRDPLLLEVVAWVAAKGRITEGWKSDPDDPRDLWLQGLACGRTIHINPLPDTLDTLIHEVLHVIRPHYSELGVRRRTKQLMRHMTEGELLVLWDIYQDRLKRERKRGKGSGVSPTGGRLVDRGAREGHVSKVRGGTPRNEGDGLQGRPDVLPSLQPPLVAPGTRQAVAICSQCGSPSSLTAGGAHVETWDGSRGPSSPDVCGDCRNGDVP